MAASTTPTPPPPAAAPLPPPVAGIHRSVSTRDVLDAAASATATALAAKVPSGRKKSTVAVTVPSYVDKKRAKAEVAASRRRSSMLLAREGSSRWVEAVQANSSDSDSEVEYADADHDSEDEAVEHRRKSVTAEFTRSRQLSSDAPVPEGALRAAARRRSIVLANTESGAFDVAATVESGGASPTKQSVVRRQTLASFRFGDVVTMDTSMPMFGEESAVVVPASPTGSGDVDDGDADADDPVTMIVMRRRQSAVKDRMAKRKKFKEAAFRAKLKLNPAAASAFQDPSNTTSSAADAEGSDAATKRVTDMTTVNLLTILMQELKWRMTAPTTEPLPLIHTTMNHVGSAPLQHNSAMFSPPAPSGLPSPAPSSTVGSVRSSPPPLFSPTASLDVAEGASLLRKLARSANTAKLYDGSKPPTTALSTAPGSAAVALATSAAVNAPGGAAATFYPLWYPNATDRRLALQKAESEWMQRIAPLLSKVSDIVMARSSKLHGGVPTTPSRRTMPPSKLTPSSLSQQVAPPVESPPSARKKGDALSPSKAGGTNTTKKKTLDKPVVIPASSVVLPPAPPSSQRAKVLQGAIPALLSPSDLQTPAALNNSANSLPLPRTMNLASSMRSPGGPPSSIISAGLSEAQLTMNIDRLQRVVAVAYQPLRPTIQKLIALERQADDLARQLKTAQAQEKRTRDVEGDGSLSPPPLKVPI
jgi:hypothetical protein